MSNALGIAGVTAVLKDYLNNGLIDHDISSSVGHVTVSALPPDRVFSQNQNQEDDNRLNLFLHRVTPNVGWRNMNLPSHNNRGERLSNPPLALNLHYLLTAYGSHDFHAEILLGYAMQLLHDKSVLSRKEIEQALKAPSPVDGSILPSAQQALNASELADQVEQIKITLEDLSTEEMSKIWSAMQTHYRPTAAYQISVVLIQSGHSTRSSLPVKARTVKAVRLIQPFIRKVINEKGAYEPIDSTSVLLIQGHSLKSETTGVFIGGHDLSAQATDISNSEIKLPLPSPLPQGLYAGIQTAHIVHNLDIGQPASPHRIFESNVEPFVLRPKITPSTPNNVSTEVVGGVTMKSGELAVSFDPVVHKPQRVMLLLNEIPQSTAPAHAYSFGAPPGNGIVDPATESGTIAFSFQRVVPGNYLVRVRVDGAESPLSMVNAGFYNEPKVVI
jgi:hypothetical protein